MSDSPSDQLAKRIRLHVLKMIHLAKSSHIGSNFSIADILAVLYRCILQLDPKNPHWPLRDRFLLSKGHAVAALYAVLAETGFFGLEQLETYYQDGSLLLGHSHHKVPGVEMSSGSLGHALSIGSGMALAASKRNESQRVFVLLSDGECDEGSNWEAILFASHHRLDNLFAIIDYNKLQSLDTVDKTLRLEPFRDKWQSFGWEVLEVNGHDHESIKAAFTSGFKQNRPHVLMAHTIKGKGVSFMENSVLWHYRSPQGEEYTKALEELLHA